MIEYLMMVAVTVGGLIIIGTAFKSLMPALMSNVLSQFATESGGAASGDPEPQADPEKSKEVDSAAKNNDGFKFAGSGPGGIGMHNKNQGMPALTDLVFTANAAGLFPKVK